MKKNIFLLSVFATIITMGGCKKETDDDLTVIAVEVTTSMVLNDFANSLANPNYLDIETKANALNIAVRNLNTDPTEVNLLIARNAWRDTRTAWEQAEAYLFGPVEDFNYDPTMDDWPVNRVDMDSLLASNSALTLADIDQLPTSLKGFHPIEYILFGNGGHKLAADISARERTYLESLTLSFYNTTIALRSSWDVNYTGNFTEELVTAGNGSTRFASKKDAFITIATAMAGICEEVADGKMELPLLMQDSTLEESQFSHNSTADFRNNMIGVRNVYLGNYATDGHGFNDIIASKDLALHQALQSQIEAAIASFDAIDANYGAAIFTQQVQINNSLDAIRALRQTIENDLMDFIQTHITD